MKNKTMKKVLSLILAVVMIALALPLTLPVMAEEGAAATIKSVELTLKKKNGSDIPAQYGSIAGITDGDAFDSTRSADDSWPYFYSDWVKNSNIFYYLDQDGKFAESATAENNKYRAYLVIELNDFSKIDDMTIWLGADGHTASSAAAWSNPTLNWNMNEAYDILGSMDGETWFVIDEFDKMCGNKTAKGENFPSEGDADYASKTVDGYLRLGHKIDMKDQTMRYISVAVKKGNNETHNQTGEELHAIFFGDITVNGKEVAAPTTGYTTTIKYAKMFAKYGDEWDVHANYGGVAAMIDGDPNPGYDGSDKRSSYTYYQSDDLYDGITYYYLDSENKLTLDTEGTNKTYMGFAMFELNAKSALQDVTVWLAGDEASEWKNPATKWNMNDEYDILVSNDGETWTVVKSYTDMCGDGTNKGANFPSEGDASYATRTISGNQQLGHRIALNGTEAKYFAIGVKHGMNSTNTDTNSSNYGKERNAIVFGEVTVNGTTVEAIPTAKTPAEIYAEASDGEVIKTVNFKDMTWSDDYYNSDNWNTYVKVSEDGTSATHLLHGAKTFGANNKRAMWGGIAENERFSLNDGSKYTLVFDVDFGSTAYNTYGFGIQVDGDNTLVIDGFGCCYWYNWNTRKVNKSDADADKWNFKTDRAKADKQSFAVEVDPVSETMTLFVGSSDGTYAMVRSMTYDGADISGSLICRLYTIRVNGEKTLNGDCWSEISDLKIFKGLVVGQSQSVAGASVRLDNPTGIRFSSEFRKTYIDGLKATYGEDNVKMGMLITPTDYLTNNNVVFTKEALDACTAISGAKYVKIDAVTVITGEFFYTINCALTEIKEANYNRAFSARAYIEVNGEIYEYAAYDAEYNSRSVAEVAEAAYNDIKSAEDLTNDDGELVLGDYKYAVTVDGATKYSPYTEAQREVLYDFFN